MKGGVGVAIVGTGAVQAAAVVAVNAFGDVRDAEGRILAGARGDDGTFVDTARLLVARATTPAARDARPAETPFGNTTIGVVALTVPVDRAALGQLARAASAAFHRRITPCGTSVDGDVLFAVCPTGVPDPGTAGAPPLALEALAVHAVEQAIEQAVRTARGTPDVPGLADALP
jgi:L-aminopeptidase/D-esterase-like protein